MGDYAKALGGKLDTGQGGGGTSESSKATEILAREFEARSDITVTADLEMVDVAGSVQLTIYRLVQESLTNMGKYAEASQAVVSLQNQDGYVLVEVTDNGKGFDVSGIGPLSHGISGMRHRVEAAGGRLTIASARSHAAAHDAGGGTPSGTRISAVLPKSH